MNSKKKQTRSSRAVRKAQIMNAFDQLWKVAQVGELTMYDVAKFTGMQPSTHLTKMLMQLVDDGVLGFRTEYHRSNRDKRMFSLCNREYHYPMFEQAEDRHEIKINVNGRTI